MLDHYYLESEIKYVDNKRKFGNFNLYNRENYVKTFSKEESKTLRDKIKKENIQRKVYGNKVIIDNQRFIKLQIKLDEINKKRKNRKRKFVTMAVSSSILLLLGGVKLNNKLSSSFQNEEIAYASDFDDNYIEDNNFIEEELLTTEDNNILLESNVIDNGFENIFEFSYDDRSYSDNVYTVSNNYSSSIELYANKYGIDPKLVSAIICQENPNNIRNYDMIAGHGVTQIESIWDGNEVYAYNFETNQTESSGIINVLKCTDDQDYSIKLSCMILNNYYNTIHSNYSDILTPEQELGATIWAYNKGITAICNGLNNTDNYNDFITYVKNNSNGGDNEYIEHVLSYIKDEDIITIKSKDGTINAILIDNINIQNKNKTK